MEQGQTELPARGRRSSRLEQLLAELPERVGYAARLASADAAAAAADPPLLLWEQARQHGLAPLLAHHLPALFPLPRSEEVSARFSAARLQRLTFECLEILEEAGRRPVLLKGLAIAARYYPEPWLRPAVDVDVLVSPRELDAATQALERAGWRRATKAPATTFEYSKDVQLLAPKGGGLLELHFGYSADFQARIDVEALLSRSRVVELAGRPTRVLGETDDLLLQCVHAAHHGFEGVKWLYDLKLLALRGPRWEPLVPLSREYRVASAVGMALREAARRVRAPVPRRVLEALPPGPARAWAARRLARSKDPDVASLGTSLVLADELSPGLAQEALVRPLGRALSRLGLGRQAKQAAARVARRFGGLRRRDVPR